jgi:hypothetical protein
MKKKIMRLFTSIIAVLMMCAVINPSAAMAENTPSSASPEVENNNESDEELAASETSDLSVSTPSVSAAIETVNTAEQTEEALSTAEPAEEPTEDPAASAAAETTAEPAEDPTASPTAEPSPEATATAEAEETAEAETGTIVKTFSAENDYTVTVEYGPEANLPEDVELQVSEITDEEQVATYKEKTQATLNEQEEDVTLTTARFFDISFVENGNKVEPEAEVKVSINFVNAIPVNDSQEVKAIHFDESNVETPEEAEPAVLDVEIDTDDSGNVNSVNFSQESFSVSGVIVTDKTGGWPSKDGEYVMIVDMGQTFYAVNHYGEVYPVTITTNDAGEQVAVFEDYDDSTLINAFLWTTNKSEGTISHQKEDGTVIYIDPADSQGKNCISTEETKVVINNSGVILAQDYSGFNPPGIYVGSPADDGTRVLQTILSSGDQRAVMFAQYDITDPGEIVDEKPELTDLDAPVAEKSIEANQTDGKDNGTYKLTLSITGKAKTTSDKSKADVIVVFDESSSMAKAGSNGKSKIDEAKEALGTLADELLSKNTTENPDLVYLTILKFGTTRKNNAFGPGSNIEDASVASGRWTRNKQEFAGYYEEDQIPDEYATNARATNWEYALQQAGQVTSLSGREDVPKYVIFITDGNPTLHWENGANVGTGSDSSDFEINNHFVHAKDDARNLVKSKKKFYTLGIYGAASSSSRVESLTSYAYTGTNHGEYPSGRYLTADDEESMKKAFKNIAYDITSSLGYSDVTIYDELTTRTGADIRTDSSSFVYTVIDDKQNIITPTPVEGEENTYSYTVNGVERKFHGAEYSEGKITWNMDLADGTPFVLDKDYTYQVSFNVWPDQTAYDTVAGVKNGNTNPYSDQIEQMSEGDYEGNFIGEYGLTTNKDGTKAEYKVSKTTNGQTPKVSDDTGTVNITNPGPIVIVSKELTFNKVWDDISSETEHEDSVEVTVYRDDGDNKTEYKKIELSPDSWQGKVNISPGLKVNGETLNKGYTYSFTESVNGYTTDISTEEINPMLIDSNYQITPSDDNLKNITITNHQNGSIEILKKVINDSGDEVSDSTDEFAFSIQMVSSGKYESKDYQYKYNGTTGNLENAPNKINDSYQITYDQDTDKTTVSVNVKLQPGKAFDLINLPYGTEYTVSELTGTDYMPEGYEFVRSEWSYKDSTGIQNSTENDRKLISGTLLSNNDKLTFVNREEDLDIKISKENEKGQSLTGAKFEILDSSGSPVKEVDMTSDSTIDIGSLPSGDYVLNETKAPDGYSTVPAIIITVDRSKLGTADEKNAVTISGKDGVEIEGKAEILPQYKNGSTTEVDYFKIVVTDSPIYKLPSTGGSGIYWNFIIGTLMAMFSVYAAYAMRRSKGKEVNN